MFYAALYFLFITLFPEYYMIGLNYIYNSGRDCGVNILWEVQFGVRGQSPGGGLGVGASPRSGTFFSLSNSDCGIKAGRGSPFSVRFKGGGVKGWGAAATRSPNLQGRGGSRKGGCSPQHSPLDPPLLPGKGLKFSGCPIH